MFVSSFDSVSTFFLSISTKMFNMIAQNGYVLILLMYKESWELFKYKNKKFSNDPLKGQTIIIDQASLL